MGSTSPPSGSAFAPALQNQVIGTQEIHGDQIFNPPPSKPLTCSQSLAFPKMYDRANDIETPVGKTCEWLLRHKKWENWMSSDRRVLWIKGNPGAGKSTLLEYARRKLEKTKEGQKALILSFWFHGRGDDDLQRNPLGLFRSLLYQILEKERGAASQLVATFKNRRDANIKPDWKLNELRGHFSRSILEVLHKRRVWIFVDALDECGPENAAYVMQYFKDLFDRQPTPFRLHICFTCRHYPVQDLVGGFEISVELENSQDVLDYLRSRLSKLKHLTTPPPSDLIHQRAHGLFIWARLVADQVLDLKLGEDVAEAEIKIKETIKTVPQDLNKLYLKIVRSIENTPGSMRLIQWIRCAQRALSLDELRWAIVVDANSPCKSLKECRGSPDYTEDDSTLEEKVKILSCGLVEIVSSSNSRRIAQFIHQSIKDFFDKGLLATDDGTGSTQVGIYSAIETTHYQISRACIRYLAMEDINSTLSTGQCGSFPDFPLLEYATRWWMKHVRKSQTKDICQQDLLHDFSWPSNRVVEQWVRTFRMLDPGSPDCPPTGIHLVHIASRFNLTNLLQMILGQTGQPGTNARDDYGRTPLIYAAERGYTTAVKVLLDHKADVNAQDWIGEEYRNCYSQTHMDSVQQSFWRTEKSIIENCRKAADEFLIKHKAYVHAQGLIGSSALHWASFKGHTTIASLLLGNGADIKVKDQSGCTPMAWAIESGVPSRVQVLLEAELDLDYVYKLPVFYLNAGPLSRTRGVETQFFGMGGPPCFWMPELDRCCWVWRIAEHPSWWLFFKTVLWETLIRTEDFPLIGTMRSDGYLTMTTRSSASRDRTPLLRAVELGSHSIVRMLLAKGASPDFQGSHGWSPLSLAKQKQDDVIIKLLEANHRSSFH